MSRYVVRVVGPSGMERYLSHGKAIERQDAATRYPHPSGAYRAADSYFCKLYGAEVRAKHKPRVFVFDVIDTRDPERRV